MNNRGISAVVATVLIILITVASVTIIWVSVLPVVQENLNSVSMEDIDLTIVKEGYTVYDNDSEKASLQIQRGGDQENLKKIKTIFYFSGFSEFVVFEDVPGVNGMKTYLFDFSDLNLGFPEEVAVVPILEINGQLVEGSISHKTKIQDKKLILSESQEDLLEGSESGAVSSTGEEGLKEDGDGDEEEEDGELGEICFNGINDDLDSDVDCDDSECSSEFVCQNIQDVVAYYSFDFDKENTEGTTAYDFSSNGYDGTYEGNAVSNSAGAIYGNALQLDGDDDRVNIGEGLEEMEIWTISAWVNASSLDSTQAVLATGDYADNEGYVGIDNSGKPTISTDLTSPDAIDNDWHHITYIRHNGGPCYIGKDINFSIYVDGILKVNSVVTVNRYYFELSMPSSIGAQYKQGGRDFINDFNGLIDEVIIFNRSLTGDEILDLYNSY